jgi:hypothetical protein
MTGSLVRLLFLFGSFSGLRLWRGGSCLLGLGGGSRWRGLLGGGPGLGWWFGSSLCLRLRTCLLRLRLRLRTCLLLLRGGPGLRLRLGSGLLLGLRLRTRLLLLRGGPGLRLRFGSGLLLGLRLRTRLGLYGLWRVLRLGGT